jgi:N utilization substance protein B
MVGGQDQAAIEGHASDITNFDKADPVLYRSLLTLTLDHAVTLQDALVLHISRPWDEVSPIERCILLMAACEFSHFPEVPYRVILNEAIDLAKDYGGTDGHKFINGVLDKLALDLRPHEARRV